MSENPYESPTTNPADATRPRLGMMAYFTAALSFVEVFGIVTFVGLIGQALLLPWLFAAARWPILCYWIGVLFVAGLLATLRAVLSLKNARCRAARIATLREEELTAIETAKRADPPEK
jgi:hypothetical protein